MLLGIHLNDIDCLREILPGENIENDTHIQDTLEILDIFGIDNDFAVHRYNFITALNEIKG